MNRLLKPFKISIRARLLIVYVGIILIGFSGLTLLAGRQVSIAARDDHEQRLKREVTLMADALSPFFSAYSNGTLGEEALEQETSRYAAQINGRLTYYPLAFGDRPQGDKPNSTATPNATGDEHEPPHSFRDSPEIENAMRGEMIVVERQDEYGVSRLFTASAVQYKQNFLGVLQLSLPLTALQAEITKQWLTLGAWFIGITASALAAALWLAQSITRPLNRLREAALRLSSGDFSGAALPESADEIGAVAGAFNHMTRQVESMLEEQRSFASNTSHELRTPLTTMRLRTEALRDDPTLDAATTQQYISEIDDEVVRLSHMIEDLTLLARLDSGRAERGQSEMDMARFAANLHGQMRHALDEKRLTFTLHAPEEPLVVHGSMTHLSVSFRNVVENAIKYTPAGGNITWTITAERGGVMNAIRDSGQGIPAEALPHVFERFYRGDKSHSRHIPGTGLGLSLVKSIVDAYGGQVSVSSDGVDKGTTVSVFWPFKPQG